jgi:DNA-binding NarL/FixJ family response regulator
MMRKSIQELLSSHGYDVCGEAENGLEAVSKAIALKPDAVILDLAMPHADGLTAAHRISQGLPKTPIVLFTLHVVPQLEIEAKKHGVHCVISKSKETEMVAFLDRLRDARWSDDKHTPVGKDLEQPEDLKKAS